MKLGFELFHAIEHGLSDLDRRDIFALNIAGQFLNRYLGEFSGSRHDAPPF